MQGSEGDRLLDMTRVQLDRVICKRVEDEVGFRKKWLEVGAAPDLDGMPLELPLVVDTRERLATCIDLESPDVPSSVQELAAQVAGLYRIRIESDDAPDTHARALQRQPHAQAAEAWNHDGPFLQAAGHVASRQSRALVVVEEGDLPMVQVVPIDRARAGQ